MRTPQLNTDRLLLQRVRAEDVNDIYRCWMQDEDVSRYMFWKASADIRETEKFVEFEQDKIADDKWYRWIIRQKEGKEVIGACLIYYNEEVKSWDISYNLGKAFWGKGYATEAMRAVMDFACRKLSVKECIAMHATENPASGRVIEKLGFQYEQDIPYSCNGGEIRTVGKLYRYKVGAKMTKTLCGLNCCDECAKKTCCKGCLATHGSPFGGKCIAAEYVKGGGKFHDLKRILIEELNSLNLPGLHISDLFMLSGDFINMEYTLPNGEKIKFLKDEDVYFGNQVKKSPDKCYGIVADREFLLVSEYGVGGENPQVILYKKR